MYTEAEMTDFNNPGKLFLSLFTLQRKLSGKKLRTYCDSLGLSGHEHVLEPGSGTGALTGILSRKLSKGGSVTCVDPSMPLMNIARRELKYANNVIFVPGVIHGIKAQPKGFDACVIHYMLHDIKPCEREAFLEKVNTLLSDDGRVYIREPIAKRHGIPVGEIGSLMRDAGFREVSSSVKKGIISWPYMTAVYRKV